MWGVVIFDADRDLRTVPLVNSVLLVVGMRSFHPPIDRVKPMLLPRDREAAVDQPKLRPLDPVLCPGPRSVVMAKPPEFLPIFGFAIPLLLCCSTDHFEQLVPYPNGGRARVSTVGSSRWVEKTLSPIGYHTPHCPVPAHPAMGLRCHGIRYCPAVLSHTFSS